MTRETAIAVYHAMMQNQWIWGFIQGKDIPIRLTFDTGSQEIHYKDATGKAADFLRQLADAIEPPPNLPLGAIREITP